MNAFREVVATPGAGEALAILAKVTLLLAAAWVAAVSLQRRSAAVRHFVWLLALAGSLALPLLAPAPRIEVATPFWPESGTNAAPVASSAPRETSPVVSKAPVVDVVTTPEPAAPVSPPSTKTAPRWSLTTWALVLWLLGVACVLAWHLLGYFGLHGLARSAEGTRDPRWHWILGQSARDLGVAPGADLKKSAEVGSPLVCGIARPTIVLPIDADEWPESRRRAVALHELAHVARRDPLSQLLAGLACALYWFHPGVWWAARRMRAESERACDDRVLALGFPPAEYATHLLEVARKARTLRLTGMVAIAMARRSTLEGRLLSLLDAGRKRSAPSVGTRALAAASFALLLLVLAGIRPVARASEAHRESPIAEAAAPKPVAPADVAVTTEPEKAAIEEIAAEEVAATGTEAISASEVTESTSDDVTTIVSRDEGGRSKDLGEGIPYDGRFEVGRGGTLKLRLDTGAGVEIRGWSKNVVEVEGRVGGINQDEVAVDMDGNGDVVTLQLKQRERTNGNFSTSSDFRIMVPKRFNVDIRSAGGEIMIHGVEGDFSGRTGGGEIHLRNLDGTSRLSTGGGDIDVTDCHLSGTVSTGGGLVKISRVRGGLRGTSGSGPVIYADAGEGEKGSLDGVEIDRSKRRISLTETVAKAIGRLNIAKAGGGIDLTEAPNGAEVNTGGGDVKIGRTGGMVKATTGGGDIRIGPVGGSLEASTGAGEVFVTLSGRDANRTIDLWSGYGAIILEVPAGLGVDLDLETAYTRSTRPSSIRSDIPVEIDASTGWDDSQGTPRKYVRARATSGSGRVQVRVKTVNGNIEIRRPGR